MGNLTRWARPAPMFLLLTALVLAVAAGGAVPLAAVLAAPVVYAVAAHSRWGRAVPAVLAAVLSAVALLVLAVVPIGLPEARGAVFAVAALCGVWMLGRVVAEGRAARERDAQLLAERMVAEERLRIARELHDAVAHSMGLIAVTAGVANHVLATRPQEAHEALRAIEAESRNAMTEMRQMLGVLRMGPDRAPSTGLDGLPDLVERTRLAGVTVDLDVSGSDLVPEAVGLSAYRIVQEALANVVKHAAPTCCRVRVSADDREVRVETVDDGPRQRRTAAPAAGLGLLGMRERALAYGGAFEAGPRADAPGFRVAATLPYAVPA